MKLRSRPMMEDYGYLESPCRGCSLMVISAVRTYFLNQNSPSVLHSLCRRLTSNLVVGLHSTIEESLRNILRKSVSKVSRRYFIQGTTLVGVCRDAEMESDDSRETSPHHGRGYKR